MKVADIQAGSLDSAGTIIEEVYTKYDPNYAVYRTKSRVLVQFGDLEETEKSQRAALATLYPLRGEVNGLIDGWRGSKDATRAAKARRYERRAADALVVALEASPADGALLLQSVKADLIDGRQATGRVQYLATALATALA